MSIKEPVFVYEPNTLLVFENIWKAERYVEPCDANDSIYFDADGQILKVSIEKDNRGIEHTKIYENEVAQYDKDQLRQLIIEKLEHLNYSRQKLENKTFPQLFTEILKFKKE